MVDNTDLYHTNSLALTFTIGSVLHQDFSTITKAPSNVLTIVI
jgi:hypothetical protein